MLPRNPRRDLDVEGPLRAHVLPELGYRADGLYLGLGIGEYSDASGDAGQAGLALCARCGAPTPAEVCAFCKLVERAGGAPPEPVPVALGRRR